MSTIKLSYPKTHDEKTYQELTLRRPIVRDHIYLEHLSQKYKRDGKVLDDFEKDSFMYSRLADAPVELIQKLDVSDWGKCREFYLNCVRGLNDSEPKTEMN